MRPEADQTSVACPNCAKLEAELEELRAQIGQLQQQAARQAAPFRRPEKKRKANPKPPGRKPGHPPSHRLPPPTVDECVEAPLDCCPHCGGPVDDSRPLDQIVEEILPMVQRVRIRTWRGRCRRCGAVRSSHPEQVSRAGGAAGTQLGPGVLALVADLTKRCER